MRYFYYEKMGRPSHASRAITCVYNSRVELFHIFEIHVGVAQISKVVYTSKTLR